MIHTTLAFGAYFTAIGLVALLSYRRSHDATDFVLGGRSINFYVTALSAHASDMSTWLFMAYPAMIMANGLGGMWLAVGLLAGMWANWQFIAPRLRRETERTGSLTLSDYLAQRFKDRSGLLRLTGATASLLFFTAYVAAGLVGIGYLAEALVGIPKIYAMTIGIVLVMGYTLIGGFASVAWVDFFQALFLMAMILMVPLVAWTRLAEFGQHGNVSLSLIPEGGVVKALFLSLGWGLGYLGQTHILSKFMGIQHVHHLRKSKRVGIAWQLVCLAAATAVGVMGACAFSETLANSELVFVALVQALFHPFVASLILCGVVAAAISTMDSQLLVLVPVLSQDFYHRFLHRHPSRRATLWSSRIALVVIGVLAYGIALFKAQTVMSLVLYSWSGLGSTFGPVLLLALYSKRTTWAGALTGMLFGGFVASVWPLLPTDVPAMIPGFLGGLAFIYGVSLLTQPEQGAREHPPVPLP